MPNSRDQKRTPPSSALLSPLNLLVLIFAATSAFFLGRFNNPIMAGQGASIKELIPETSASPPIDADTFLKGFKYRRSIYAINNESTISDERIEEIVQSVVADTPSSFNSQTSRFVILLGKKNVEFWEMAAEEVKKIILATKGEEVWKHFAGRFDIFKGSYGTVSH